MFVQKWLNWLTGRAAGAAEQAESRLWGPPYLALAEVSCSYRDGVLTLRGRVPTCRLKRLAEAVVSHIGGVEWVENEIEVMAPRSRERAKGGESW